MPYSQFEAAWLELMDGILAKLIVFYGALFAGLVIAGVVFFLYSRSLLREVFPDR